MEKTRDENRRYRDVWRNLRFLFGGALRRVFAFSGDTVDSVEAPYLVVCNHNTDLDPALVGICFPKQMFFVASEHVFRKGWSSRLLIDLFKPISRTKGATDASAALDIIRSLRKGNNVCLFAEGNRSFNGVTGPIFPATGKLAKAAGVSLVTYRLEGGYLTTPRWSHTRRKGRMHGTLMHVYSPEQLKTMKPDEVNAAIAHDLYEDAFARQMTDPCDYRGKRLAEGLENALFLCPKCGGVGTLKGIDDRFVCEKCGMQATYTVQGFFTGDAPFDNVRDWDGWQHAELVKIASADGDETLFSDANMKLFRIGDKHRFTLEAEGTLSMNREGLTLGNASFPVAAISDMAQVGSSKIVFSSDGAHYEITSEALYYCGRKYDLLYKILKEKGSETKDVH